MRTSSGQHPIRWIDRRQFLAICSCVLCQPRLLLAQPSTAEEAPQRVVRALVDRLLPAHGDHPGAVALGVDVETVQALGSTRAGRLWLRLLYGALGGESFLALPPGEQDARIRPLIAGRNPTSRLLRSLLEQVTNAYFVKPQSWRALEYRTPQPDGYPDYAGDAPGPGGCHAG